MSDDEIIAVVQAHKEGKQIECRKLILREHGCWCLVRPLDYVPWDFSKFSYRVKPEPRKPREWVVKVVGDGITSFWDGGSNISTYDLRVREVIEE